MQNVDKIVYQIAIYLCTKYTIVTHEYILFTLMSLAFVIVFLTLVLPLRFNNLNCILQ